jgi:hypothetical protein
LAAGSAFSILGSISGITGNFQGLSLTETSPADQMIKNVPNVYAPTAPRAATFASVLCQPAARGPV